MENQTSLMFCLLSELCEPVLSQSWYEPTEPGHVGTHTETGTRHARESGHTV